MSGQGRTRIVVLGMMTKMPVAGVVWQTVHYLEGLRRLGYDVWYVEAHARTPSMLMAESDGAPTDGGARAAAAFIASVMRRFGFQDRWAYHALHADERCYGIGEHRLRTLYREAALLLNLHGGTRPLPEHAATGRLVYVGTDPVQTEVELAHGNGETAGFLEAHTAFFTFGENYGAPDCRVPLSHRFEFRPTRQPVVLDFWAGGPDGGTSAAFTTVASWSQPWRDLRFEGELYRWSKDHEFLKFLELPRRSGARFELALSACPTEDRARLEAAGWRVRDALSLSRDIDVYRAYLAGSRGEFTVAKDQNVRLRSGWFSDRSATYLAAGRPVITQDTGFGNILPTGRGLFPFTTLDDALAAVAAVRGDPRRHGRAAREIACEHFDHRVVLGRLLGDVGLSAEAGSSRSPGRGGSASSRDRFGRGIGRPLGVGAASRATGSDAGTAPVRADRPFPTDLVIEPVGRRPLRLAEETLSAIAEHAAPGRAPKRRESPMGAPSASIVVVTFGKLPLTRLCLESVLGHTEAPPFEVIVVDNGSTDGTADYLRELARRDPRVRVRLSGRNLGFAAATNVGLGMAAGTSLVLLNNDTIVPPRWLTGLCRHLENPRTGAVGPVTNRICNEAQVECDYRTYGGFLRHAAVRARRDAGASFEIPFLAMYCFAMRSEVHRRIGGLDESFGIGTLEDDDYCLRLLEAGYALRCAEDVYVHHFGEASFGDLVPGGAYDELLRENRRRFERKWGRPWRPYGRRPNRAYRELVGRIRSLVPGLVPEGASILVASRGDDALVDFSGRRGAHFPQTENGVWAGHYPADSRAAIRTLEGLRRRGAEYLLIPRTGFWWLEHYAGFGRHLDRRYGRIHRDPGTCVVYHLDASASRAAGGSRV